MKHTVRSFSVGLLTSAVILLIVFYFIEEPVQSAKDMDAEKIIPLIEAEGYTVLSKEEYIELSIGKTEKDQEETETKEASPSENNETEQEESPTEEQNSTAEKEAEEENSPDESADEEEEIKEAQATYTLTISPGMASSDISSLLAENQIIQDASEFNSYLDEHDYSLQIQIGSYELTSDMSFYQIAERLAH